ncbi:hypothetical protein AAVH_38670 [Aphelenchoides avenae]|nr:hypothetical protein AAVH_38670 [Aphelenchus avenae]
MLQNIDMLAGLVDDLKEVVQSLKSHWVRLGVDIGMRVESLSSLTLRQKAETELRDIISRYEALDERNKRNALTRDDEILGDAELEVDVLA